MTNKELKQKVSECFARRSPSSQNIRDLIDEYIKSTESRTCESCEYCVNKTKRGIMTKSFYSNDNCSFCNCFVKQDDGCNKWEQK